MAPARTNEAMTRFLRHRTAPLLLVATLLTACGGREAAEALLGRRAASPHERYAESLRQAGLAAAALGRDWLAAAARATAAPLVPPVPDPEGGYFRPTEPTAVGLRVQPRRGQRLTVSVE